MAHRTRPYERGSHNHRPATDSPARRGSPSIPQGCRDPRPKTCARARTNLSRARPNCSRRIRSGAEGSHGDRARPVHPKRSCALDTGFIRSFVRDGRPADLGILLVPGPRRANILMRLKPPSRELLGVTADIFDHQDHTLNHTGRRQFFRLHAAVPARALTAHRTASSVLCVRRHPVVIRGTNNRPAVPLPIVQFQTDDNRAPTKTVSEPCCHLCARGDPVRR